MIVYLKFVNCFRVYILMDVSSLDVRDTICDNLSEFSTVSVCIS